MPIKAALIDLSGTLHIESEPTENSIEALKKLRTLPLKIRFVTNTTKESGQTLFDRLLKIGFQLDKNEIYSTLSATASYVVRENLNPLYLLSDDAVTDFPSPVDPETFDSVVIGLAPDAFCYEKLNQAFNILRKNHPLIATHEGKYYKRSDGLALGPGCFVKGLEYAASTKAIVVGKPNRFFFESAIPQNIKPEECVMIGDDPIDDIKGAMAIGMIGILVKTGKYLPDVIIDPPPIATLENFAEAVDWIEEHI